ncbi:hypothetical protein MNBD_GAMMA09-2894 [hydrothermal vent metagenome]|uniref:Uncharacterized protein n=1 Tax=hydrothermal vent metagenome TaxID=652676 RepID=A0A3B0XLY6_9ZZZZ
MKFLNILGPHRVGAFCTGHHLSVSGIQSYAVIAMNNNI